MSGNDITLSSTTDPAEAVEAALSHDEATHYSESAPSSGTVTIVSSTDDAAAVSDAATMHGEELVEPEPYFTPIVQSADRSVASTTDSQQSVNQAAEDLQQEKDERPDYLGKSRRWRERGLVEQVRRQAAQIDELRGQLADREPAPQVESGEPVDDQQQQPQPSQLTPEQQQQFRLRQQAEWELKKIQGESSLPYRLELFRQSHPDADQVLGQLPELPPAFVHVLRTESDGLPVFYYLGQHPDVARNIIATWQNGNQQQAASMLDQISIGLRFQSQNQPAQQQRPQNHDREPRPAAPRPLRHVGGSANTSQGDPNQMNMRDYNNWRNAGGGR